MCRTASLSASVIFFFLAIAITVTPSSQESDRVDPFYEKLFSDGIVFFKSGNYPEAVENFEIAFFGFLDHPSKLLECYIYLTVCHFKLKDLEKAKHYLDEIDRLKLRDRLEKLKLPEDLADAFLEVTTYLDRLGLRAKTGAPFSERRATALSPTPSPAPLPSPQTEIRELRSAIKADRLQPAPYFRLSAVYLEQKKFKEARKVLEDLIKAVPSSGAAYLELGKIHALEKNHKKALEAFQKASPFLSGSIELQYEMGKAYFELRNYEKAGKEFAAVQQISPTYKDTEKYVSLLEEIEEAEQKKTREEEEKAAALKAPRAEAPPSKTARIEQPPDPLLLAREEKSLRKKISYYHQALEKDPGNLDIYFEMCDAYIAAKKYRDAAAVFEALLQYFPKNLRIHTELANAYYLNKSYGKALNILARAREIENTDEVCYLLGKAYMALKNYKEAAAGFSHLLSQSPDYKDAPALYKLCLEKLKK